MQNLKNCKRCGKLFLKTTRDICPDCHQKEEDDFLKVKQYLDKNPGATIVEVSEETEVSQKQIRKFIEEGRLLTSKYEALTIECKRCGKEISQGKYCESCQGELSQQFESVKGEPKQTDDETKETGKVHIKDRVDKRRR
ncbi:TIGR03826 family flagellar region protein [Natranaerobius thermophilus]|uniref:Flagellar protein n=1 Tax=Natranaerobius thermophilus (strain ATCC BAA-1301 / DSM 18059 / JW/NM-WN-LF) TaxID=457570 RepID=B2A837_NATTJ|nr:TIGR03826 family flagellar region protein [Natranaerobius thermophilus]ACB85805.1 flagellar protein [Natranaerobius thermophilus JW/NM-WN-LF]